MKKIMNYYNNNRNNQIHDKQILIKQAEDKKDDIIKELTKEHIKKY